MFNLGASLISDGDFMGRAGISFRIGHGGKKKPELARDMVGMQQQMYVMQASLNRLEEHKRGEAERAKLQAENERNKRIIEENAELIRELTKQLEAQK